MNTEMMTKSKDKIRDIIMNDLLKIHERRVELSKQVNENLEESLDYLRTLSSQLSQSTSGLIVAKTPRLMRKRVVQRIETIPENEVFQQEHILVDSHHSVDVKDQETSEISNKLRRTASKRAAENIKQFTVTVSAKQKLSNEDSDSTPAKKEKRKGQIKRKKCITSSSDEEDNRGNVKYSKVETDLPETKSEITRKAMKKKSEPMDQLIEKVTEKSSIEDTFKSSKSLRSSKSSDRLSSKNVEAGKRKEEKNDTIVASNTNDIEDLSMYEDAIGKTTPLMNSTSKYSTASEKMLDAVVILEQLPQQRKLNETVVIQKAPSVRNSKESKESKKALQENTQTCKKITQNDDYYNELITDDESPVEKKSKKSKNRPDKKQNTKEQTKRAKSTSSDDEIPNTPVRKRLRDAPALVQESKTIYKPSALFSPYAKESVRKRVEAFEQAVMHSPKSVDVDVPMRITRTKTRAMAAVENETETKNVDKNVTQILARKSVAKAKKISLAKQKKDNTEFKENKEQMPERINKLLLNDKFNSAIKQMQQQKTTPLSKIKITQPLSNTKALTASRSNIITGVESFYQPPKIISKTNSVEKLEEKKRQEEDARKKREEALRLQTEEKRKKRQEKELRNKLAREAKEKQELEKRQKTEREREEKARLALLIQEKQREEIEKKRLAQLQRTQETEERRKLEQQRLRKLQEQEEAERFAEQKRREQEAEKRKEMEAKAHQQAEALRQKNQMLAAQVKHKQQINNKHQGMTNYVLDSEPDDDESDDESKPKHEIPYWAQPQVRKIQLALQRHIPQEIIYKFFDTRKCTPDLTDMFHGIDRKRLKRTSSAIWKTPPRISMMETE